VQLCLDSTKAFLASTTCAEQLDVSTFEQKNVYTIEGPSEMLSNTDKSLVEVNAIFECYRIKNDQRTRIQFIEMNETREDGSIYYWLQLDNICVSVFFACKRWKAAPLHPQSSPALVINESGRSFIIAISRDETFYKRNDYSDLRNLQLVNIRV